MSADYAVGMEAQIIALRAERDDLAIRYENQSRIADKWHDKANALQDLVNEAQAVLTDGWRWAIQADDPGWWDRGGALLARLDAAAKDKT